MAPNSVSTETRVTFGNLVTKTRGELSLGKDKLYGIAAS